MSPPIESAAEPTYTLLDPATGPVAPLLHLRDSPVATLTARAATHWLDREDVADWGASMLLVGSTRRLLQQGGVLIEADDYTRLPSQHPKWLALLERVQSRKASARERLYFVRLLLYLNFVDGAEQLAHQVLSEAPGEDEMLWATYLAAQAGSLKRPHQWDASGFEAALRKLSPRPGVALLHSALFLAAHSTRAAREPRQAADWLNQAGQCLSEVPELQREPHFRALASARFLRHKAAFHGVFEQDFARQERLLAASEEALRPYLQPSAEVPETVVYLARETLRRTVAYRVISSLEQAQPERASAAARQAVELDPHCAHALALAGEAARREGNPQAAAGYFARARLAGILERPYAQQLMAESEPHPLLSQMGLIDAAEAGLCFSAQLGAGLSERALEAPQAHEGARTLRSWARSLRPAQPPGPVIPMSPGYMLAMVKPAAPAERAHEALILQSEPYQRMRPFWELRATEEADVPLSARTPLVAFEAWKQRKAPSFSTLYTQRGVISRLREELFFASVPNLAIAQRELRQASSPEILRGRSPQVDELLAAVQHAHEAPPLERAYLGRLLGALGFYPQAMEAAPMPSMDAAWSVEEQYLASTHMFLKYCYELSRPNDYPRLVAAVFSKLQPASEENLRIRLVTALHGVVDHSKKRDLAGVLHWQPLMMGLWREVERSASFSDFEKQQLGSRVYRASSFLPFLKEDRAQLRVELELCERMAREAQPTTTHEALIKQDNLYACLESMARGYLFLAEPERASSYTEELTVVDRYDSRAWLQAAEFREKRRNMEGAQEAFLLSARFGPPYGAIACYRAGRCLEKLGDLAHARQLYLRSLRFAPTGVSPLMRLITIAVQTGDTLLRHWTEEALGTARSTGQLSEEMIQRLESLTGQAGAGPA